MTPFDRAFERRLALTSRWGGTRISAKVTGAAVITKPDHYVDSRAQYPSDPEKFEKVEGVVCKVTPANGGKIELEDGTWISFHIDTRGLEELDDNTNYLGIEIVEPDTGVSALADQRAA